MKTCFITGSADRALGPIGESSVGTSRQPSTVWPSSDDDLLEDAAARRGLRGIARQEHEPGAVVAGGGEGDAEAAALAGEERVGHLDHDARAVARVRLAAAGAAVEQVLQHGERLAHDGVRLSALDVDDEADAAGVVLVSGIVEALRVRHPWSVVDIACPFLSSCEEAAGPRGAYTRSVKLEA